VEQACGVPYVLLDGGIQTLGLFTDTAGEALLPDLSDGRVELTAAFGSRSGKATIEPRAPYGVIRLGAGG
jgi:hypothetical protein